MLLSQAAVILELAAVELDAVRPGQLAAVALAVVPSLPHVAVTVTPEALLVQFPVSRNLLSLTRQRTARYEYDKLFQPNFADFFFPVGREHVSMYVYSYASLIGDRKRTQTKL